MKDMKDMKTLEHILNKETALEIRYDGYTKSYINKLIREVTR